MQVDQGLPHKTSYTKTNTKNVGKSLEHMGTGEIFLNRTPIAYVPRSRIDKWDLRKLQNFCKSKDTVNRTKWQATNWKNIFINPPVDRGLISNIYKELKELDSGKQNNPIKNGVQSKTKNFQLRNIEWLRSI